MKTILLATILMTFVASVALGQTYRKSFPFDLNGCKRHIEAIAKAVKDAGGHVKRNDSSGRSYRVTLNGKIIVYTCTRHELLETEL